MSSHVLDVVIGMIYVYLIFSLMCTVVNEMIAGVLSLRAKALERGIKSLFSEDTGTTPTTDSFTNKIYSHALVRGLYQGPERTAVGPTESVHRSFLFGRVKLPSYIPAATFATALIDSIAPAASIAQNAFGDVQSAIQALPDSATKKALLSLLLNTKGDLQEFQKNVEGWFNDSMDRISGWYKRQTKKILLVIAFAIVIGVNADSIKMAKALWIDPAIRESTIKLAQDYEDSHKIPSSDAASLKSNISELEKGLPASLPIGWSGEHNWNYYTPLGWIFTALAMSLGAPFWFDVLNKFMVIRSTVKPKEKSGETTKG